MLVCYDKFMGTENSASPTNTEKSRTKKKQIEKIVKNKRAWYVYDEESGQERFNLEASIAFLTALINEVIYPRHIKTKDVKGLLLSQFNSGLQFRIQVENEAKETSSDTFLNALIKSLKKLDEFVPVVLASKGVIFFQYSKADRTEVLGVIHNYWKGHENSPNNIRQFILEHDKISVLADHIKEIAASSEKPIKLIVVDDKNSELEAISKALSEVDKVDLVVFQVTKDEAGQTNHQELYGQILTSVQNALDGGCQPLVVLDLDNTLIDTDRALVNLADKLASWG